MSVSILCSLLGGLAFFLYGMWMMRDGLEEAAGERLSKILREMTASPLRGLFAGIVVTALLQSSSAMMVILIGLMSARLLTLGQTIWLILGANIGTTVTGQLLAFDIGPLASVLAFAGILLMLCAKEGLKYAGSIAGGLGLLFLGMEQMGAALLPMGQTTVFRQLLTKCDHPFAGILAGVVLTAVIQSSSAAVGILQTLAREGLITLGQSIYQVFGQNIGTCATAFLALLGTGGAAGRAGKDGRGAAGRKAAETPGKGVAVKVALLHLLVNLIGTVIFTVFCALLPAEQWIAALSPGNVPRQIANVHTLFNVGTMLALAPFGEKLAGWVEKAGVPAKGKH